MPSALSGCRCTLDTDSAEGRKSNKKEAFGGKQVPGRTFRHLQPDEWKKTIPET
jgi:hypothetical protein